MVNDLGQFVILSVFFVGACVCVVGSLWALYRLLNCVSVRKLTPRRGTVARCSKGRVGVIEVDEPVPIQYQDGGRVVAWTGRCIWPTAYFGQVWSSRNPKILGQVQ